MASKKSNPEKRLSTKGKASARANAVKRRAERDRAPQGAKASTDRQASQGRFEGETPLTGEDRPANRRGGKVGQGSKRKA
jgi:hypothetical protein